MFEKDEFVNATKWLAITRNFFLKAFDIQYSNSAALSKHLHNS